MSFIFPEKPALLLSELHRQTGSLTFTKTHTAKLPEADADDEDNVPVTYLLLIILATASDETRRLQPDYFEVLKVSKKQMILQSHLRATKCFE